VSRFGGIDPQDPGRVPAEPRNLLVAHIQAGGDEDKLFAIRKAFEEKPKATKGSREKH